MGVLIGQLPCLRHLNLEGCKYLKELPHSIGHLTALYHLNLNDCVNLKRLPKPITQLTTLSCLNMKRCSNLKLLPEQLGDMKGLERLDASDTAIEQLPDSVAHLNKLVELNLRDCKKLRKLPEQFGNMEALETFDAAGSAIEQLPDSFSNLLNLYFLNLTGCSQLKRLPEHLGKMQSLKWLYASYTAIEELPDSIGLLPRIELLNFRECEKLTYVPNSIWNLKSLARLILTREDIIKIESTEAINDMKLEALDLSCNIRVWLPIILSSSSLRYLRLRDECGSPFPTKPFSFFQLFNLLKLSLINCTSHGSSFPELPLSLERLEVDNHASLEQVPDLSYLKHLKSMSITRCCSLQSLQKLPPHLLDLTVYACPSLQDFPDLSMLRDLVRLFVYNNDGNLKVNLEENHLQVRRGYNEAFRATIQNKEIPKWFDYKNTGCTLSFDVPPNLGDNLVGVALWVVHEAWSMVKAVITNKTRGSKSKRRRPNVDKDKENIRPSQDASQDGSPSPGSLLSQNQQASVNSKSHVTSLTNQSSVLKLSTQSNGGGSGGLFGARHRSPSSPIRPIHASSNRKSVIQRNKQSHLRPTLPHMDSSKHGSVLYTEPQFTSPGSSCLSNVSPNDTIIKDLQHSNPTRERKDNVPKSTVVSKPVKRVRRLDTTKEGMPWTNLFCEEDEEDGNTEEAVHHTQGDPDALYEDDDMGYDGGLGFQSDSDVEDLAFDDITEPTTPGESVSLFISQFPENFNWGLMI
ncbi:hypothetical protein ACET3Z_032290 [Daucus carota]